MFILNNTMKDYDTEIWDAIQKEIQRQEEHIELIASENYVSPAIMQAQGSHLTNKYAEGYPENRYYGGCEYVDLVEKIAIDRAKILFKADYANVQPHSGSQANLAVYSALLQPGDMILGMKLDQGGHLTHGAKVNFSGKLYNVISYGLNEKGYINYDEIYRLAKMYKPKMIIGGFSAYSGIVNWKKIRKIADYINAYFLVDMSHIAGLVATGLYPNPIPYAHVVTTTTHKTLAGPRGGMILSSIGEKNFYDKLNRAIFPGLQGGPLIHVIAGKAIAFKEAMEPKFRLYQKQVIKNAKEMVKVFLSRNYKVVSGHTENHLFLLDFTNDTFTGKMISDILNQANIIVNKNSVPNDKRSPFLTSGIRIGTPSVTRRGFKECEVNKIANWICDIIKNIHDKDHLQFIKKKVLYLCNKYPVYKK
ncbi:serine hydroxymethyltransferase [Candidatus Schneideria nysicola]|uniref:serine hydroxymethyltransferase n=1 Tax=Candidatus Schneideria nysicola TaxID=1081631 RepID=UPI001CAA4C45|nr:serine hydroxymethyltransferase [Candidatus Schneideria nysicola]UAJ65214.1 serine hydroxymethyltransferase [Candidatus Schneideria nysicola]